MEVEIDLKKTVVENANTYYEKAKQCRRKIDGAKKALSNTESRPSKRKAETIRIRKKSDLRWYETFRWFTSSDGFLVVGGKDATSNETLIKKHTNAADMVFHANVQGAPFFVVNNPDEKDIPATTLEEAAQASAAYSSAWKAGAGSCDVYAVKPEQLSKTPESGEYLAKGAFVVRGTREWHKNVALRVCIGFSSNDCRVFGGPEGISGTLNAYIILEPGDRKTADTAKDIREYLRKKINVDLPLEEIQRWIPSGGSHIREKR
ncbi:MAG: NFACT RNA binding domain-containing protein [Candidatus Altiarchaeota archaeon]